MRPARGKLSPQARYLFGWREPWPWPRLSPAKDGPMRWTYLINRLVFLVLVIWSASTVNFFLPRISGQDPIRTRMVQQMGQGVEVDKAGMEAMIQAYDHEFGLDKPLWQQYLNYLGDLMRLDLKQSIANYPLRVSDLINGALPWTIGL